MRMIRSKWLVIVPLSLRPPAWKDLHEVDLLPPDALSGPPGRLRDEIRKHLGHPAELGAVRPEESGAVLPVESRRAGTGRPARVRRCRGQRAPSERLRL